MTAAADEARLAGARFIKMVFDIGMPNIAVNLLDGAFEIVKHKKDCCETRSIFRDLKGSLLTQQTRLQVK